MQQSEVRLPLATGIVGHVVNTGQHHRFTSYNCIIQLHHTFSTQVNWSTSTTSTTILSFIKAAIKKLASKQGKFWTFGMQNFIDISMVSWRTCPKFQITSVNQWDVLTHSQLRSCPYIDVHGSLMYIFEIGFQSTFLHIWMHFDIYDLWMIWMICKEFFKAPLDRK